MSRPIRRHPWWGALLFLVFILGCSRYDNTALVTIKLNHFTSLHQSGPPLQPGWHDRLWKFLLPGAYAGSPPADVVRMHLVLYEGEISESGMILHSSLNPFSENTVMVPAGRETIILILSENASGQANYSGKSPTLILEEGENREISITMNTFAPVLDYPGVNYSWNALDGADQYLLQRSNDYGTTYDNLYQGPNRTYEALSGTFRVRAIISYLNIEGIWSNVIDNT